ncbi:MAG: ABC transporter permease [Candidatus Zixiibacteriota bacterium]|nr:MAG: ABC transporter permease [candidate division Zixibacteria bacterium]
MRPIFVLIRKEFQQILRDRAMIGIILIMPLVQLFLLSYAVTTDVKHIKLALLDQDRSRLSRQIGATLVHSGYFDLESRPATRLQAGEAIQEGRADLAVIIPLHFARDLETGRSPAVQVIVDGQNSNTSAIALGYVTRILQEVSSDILIAGLAAAAPGAAPRFIEAQTRVFYNPEMESIPYMIPGVISVLLTVATMLLTGMGLVREKEIGTFEQLMVTPIRPGQLLIGKLVPFALLGFLMLILALTVARVWFGLPFEGSPGLVALATLLFLLTTLGIGLFISTVTSTQQQALFIAWFVMVFSMLMSGFFYPIDNMPEWAQRITLLNPMRYYLAILRSVLLKGSGLVHLWPDFAALAVFGVGILSLTVARFRARVG